MPSWAKHACHFGEETRKPRVVDRGFDIDHRVEGLVGEGQVLSIALHELQASQIVSFSAKVDAGRVPVQSGVGGRVHGAHEVVGSAAVAATDLQHPLAAEIHLGRSAVVQLDTEPVGFVGAASGRAIGGSSS